MNNPTRKRLAVSIPFEMHDDLARVARERNESITALVERTIYILIKEHNKLLKENDE